MDLNILLWAAALFAIIGFAIEIPRLAKESVRTPQDVATGLATASVLLFAIHALLA